MKSSLLLISVGLFFVSCTKQQPLVFSDVNYEKTSELHKDQGQAKVQIDLVLALSENAVSDSINTTLYNFIESVVYLGEEKPDFSSYEAMTSSFVASYEELKKEYPDEVGWEANIKTKITFQTEKLLNIKVEYYMFTGGAHGYFGVKSLLFDLETGKSLTPHDLFSDNEKLKLFAEQKFRKDFQIGENQPINATGFMFEDDVFYLPENVFFTEEGLLFHYNVYEISSYADGYQTFVIDYEQGDKFLRKEYKPSFINL